MIYLVLSKENDSNTAVHLTNNPAWFPPIVYNLRKPNIQIIKGLNGQLRGIWGGTLCMYN